jgi:hypothetical protein
VTQIRVRKVADAGEVDDQRKSQLVCNLDRAIKGMVVYAAFGSLHPVDNGLAVGIGSTRTPDRHT